MSKAILEKLEKKITTTTETKDLIVLAKAYAEVEKADTDRIKNEAAIEDRRSELEFEREKLAAETVDKERRAILEQSKLDVDAVVRKTQLDNDKTRIDNDLEIQMRKIRSNSIDNRIMATAMGGGILLMYGCEKAGILLSRNAGSLFKFIHFNKVF